jgi:prepilin-type processing-associated H-X9-DG protein
MQHLIRRGGLGPLDRVRIGLIGHWVPAPDLLSPEFQRPQPAAPMRPRTTRRRSSVPALLVGGSALIGLATMAAFLVNRGLRGPQVEDPQPACSHNLTRLARALRMYADDHADGFPSWEVWGAAAFTRARDRAVFVCPAAPGDPGYGYNAGLAGLKPDAVTDPGKCVMLWDAGALGPFPGLSALGQGPRHDGGDNYAFVDGRAAWRLRGPYSQGDTELRP